MNRGWKYWIDSGVMVYPELFNWLIKAAVFQDLVNELDMYAHLSDSGGIWFGVQLIA